MPGRTQSEDVFDVCFRRTIGVRGNPGKKNNKSEIAKKKIGSRRFWRVGRSTANRQNFKDCPSFCDVGYKVCVINVSYSFQWMFLKLCRHTENIFKICMYVLN